MRCTTICGIRNSLSAGRVHRPPSCQALRASQLLAWIGLAAVAAVWATSAGADPARPPQRARIVARLAGGGVGTSVRFSPDGSMLLTAGFSQGPQGSEIRIWDATTLKPLGPPIHQDDRLWTAEFLSGGDAVLVIGYDVIRVYDTRTGKARFTLPKAATEVPTLAISQDGARIAFAAATKDKDACEVQVLDSSTGKLLLALSDDRSIDYMTFSPDKSTLLTLRGHLGILRLWDLRHATEPFKPIQVRYGAWPSLGSDLVPASFSPDGKRLVVAEAPIFAVYDVASGKKLLQTGYNKDDPHDPRDAGIGSAAFTADGKRIVTPVIRVKLWDASRGVPLVRPIDDTTYGPWHVNRDGTRLTVGEGIWDLASGGQLWTFVRGPNNPPDLRTAAVAVSPDGRRAATADYDGLSARNGMTFIWDIAEPRAPGRRD
jgi:WD40 repeat protein